MSDVGAVAEVEEWGDARRPRGIVGVRITRPEDMELILPLARDYHLESRYSHVPFSEAKFRQRQSMERRVGEDCWPDFPTSRAGVEGASQFASKGHLANRISQSLHTHGAALRELPCAPRCERFKERIG